MSLMEMNRVFKKYGTVIGGIAALLMLIVSLSGLGSNVMRGGGPDGGPRANVDKPAAIVGDLSITKDQLDQQLDQLMKQQMGMMGPLTGAERDRYRYALLSRYKQQAALGLAAKAAGITVSPDDINRERDKQWALHRSDIAAQLGLPATATDSDIDKSLSTQQPGLTAAIIKQRMIPDDAIKAQIYQQGLTNFYKKQVKVNEDLVKQSYDDIKVRHILIKSGDGGLPDAQAKERAEKVLAEVKANPDKMADLAKQYSDDPGSKDKGGLYDWAPAGQYVPEFTQGALDAGVGKLNPEPVKTSFGYHIIKLEGERPGKDFPKDWATNKQKYIDQYMEKMAGQKAQAAVAAQLPNVKETVLDPGMLASKDEDDARSAADPKTRTAKLQAALDELNKIAKDEDRAGDAPQRRAEILMRMNRPTEAIAAYKQALNYRNTVDTRLSLAELYQKQKDNADALKQVEEGQKLAVSDVATEYRIASLLAALGAKDQAALARAKAADMLKREQQIAAQDRAANAANMPPAVSMPKAPTNAPGSAPPATAPPTTAATPAAPSSPGSASAPATASSPVAAASPAAPAASVPVPAASAK